MPLPTLNWLPMTMSMIPTVVAADMARCMDGWLVVSCWAMDVCVLHPPMSLQRGRLNFLQCDCDAPLVSMSTIFKKVVGEEDSIRTAGSHTINTGRANLFLEGP